MAPNTHLCITLKRILVKITLNMFHICCCNNKINDNHLCIKLSYNKPLPPPHYTSKARSLVIITYANPNKNEDKTELLYSSLTVCINKHNKAHSKLQVGLFVMYDVHIYTHSVNAKLSRKSNTILDQHSCQNAVS